ncbi:helix-turn-helix domain-containing protein [Micromonospora carbonacea]|uniref:Helix-turn-helix domain-containing protein n=1 Tax=Micromonospora carbonacea TaxID=47853 RepID=A0A1C5ABF8_9ACTN|nr:helix-turn-helix transcriptional regulator [Micromonospora carbonacea]SCF42535.1 Helix-turn-helix domain-containing protein [Micromonospora carbonacea]
MDDFGHILRRRRKAAGLSLRKLGERTGYDYGYLSQVERGTRRLSTEMVAAYDNALEAGGALTDAYASRRAGDTDMRRRRVLQAMGALAAAPAVDRLTGWEALRHGLGAATDFDEWSAIVAGYGVDYYRLPADRLMAALRADLDVLGHQIAATDGQHRQRLLGVAGLLSTLVALEMVSAGEQVAARRWWASARRMADLSGDAAAKLWVDAWDAVNGCYDGRTVAALPASVDALPPVERPSAAGCQLLAGRAQALSLAGRHGEAVAVVNTLTDMAGRLPSDTADGGSLWGWSETRTQHTRSWVFTHAGRLREAGVAQDRALALYPAHQPRLRAQVQLHRAAGMVRGGDVSGGIRYAGDVLDALPVAHHNELVRFTTARVVEAVPAVERGRGMVRELAARAG